MKTALVIALIVCAIVVAAIAIPSPDGLECSVVSTSDGHAGPQQKARYTFLSGGRFAQDGSVGPMKASPTTITLAEPVDGPNGSHFSAITIDRATGAYRWEAHGQGWSTSTAGQCRKMETSR